MVKGSYSLLIQVSEPIEVEISTRDSLKLEKGFYIYNGSAFGQGGFKRVERHLSLSRGEKKYTVHWHIDRITSKENSRVRCVFKAPKKDIEDELTIKADLETVPGFGAGDSEINSHLLYSESYEEALEQMRNVYEDLTNGKYSEEKIKT